MTTNQTAMERMSVEMFMQKSEKTQIYHVDKALNKLRRRQITLTHILTAKYQEVMFHNSLKDVFYMNTYIRAFVQDICENNEVTQHPYIQMLMNPIRFREVLMDTTNYIEKMLDCKKSSVILNSIFHFVQQFGQLQKGLKEKYSVSWIPVLPNEDDFSI